MKFLAVILLATIALTCAEWATYTGSDECQGTPNPNPIYEGTQLASDQRLIKSAPNGKVFQAGTGDDRINIIHLWGTPFEKGFAHGQMMSQELHALYTDFLEHVDQEIEVYLKNVPKVVADWIAKVGLHYALDQTYEFTKAYTPLDITEELQGLADGSGVDLQTIIRVHMLPELVKAGCSLFGATKSATPNPTDLIQLRSLDWDANGPLQKCSAVMVYHYDNTSHGIDYANIGWCGFIGVVSGVSSSRIALSEKHGDRITGEDSRIGIPFTYMLRDLLKYVTTVEGATNAMSKAHRTCSVHLGVGDGKASEFTAYDYSWESLISYNWMDEPTTSEHSMAVRDVAWFGVRAKCEGQLLTQLGAAHNITAYNTVHHFVSVAQTGNLHSIVYDLNSPGLDVYIANAAAPGASGPHNAYDRTFNKLQMKSIFAVTNE